MPTPTAIKIDSVAAKYAMQDFSFEVNPETGRAGIRLEYNYPSRSSEQGAFGSRLHALCRVFSSQ